MATRIDEKAIIEINERFIICKNKSQVAREMGISSSTVAKYLVKDYVPKSEQKLTQFDGKISGPSELFFTTENFGSLCSYTEEEKTKMRELWKEMLV